MEHLEDVEKYNKIHPDVIPPACGLPEQTGGRKVEPGIQNAIVPTYLPTYLPMGSGVDSRHPLHWSGAMRE